MMLPRRTALFLVMTVLVTACGAPAPTSTPRPTPSPPAPTPSAEGSGAAGSARPSPALSPSLPPGPPSVSPDPPPLALELVADGLEDPISIAATPDGRLLVNERGGRAVLLDPASGSVEVAVDLSDRVLGEGERGLLGLALHPSWPDDPRAFAHYTDAGGRSVLAAFRAESTDPVRLDPASESVLLRVDQPYANHNGGQVAFGPDGYLYLGLGDGGSGGDPLGHGQNTATLLGAVLRIDVDDPAASPYAIPPENPFVDGGGAPEIFAYGLRNPWRFSFDRLTGELWIADVGQGAYEEVNRLDPTTEAGANLGWNVMEGAHCYAVSQCSTDGLTLPVSEYDHDRGCSVTGGYVYRGAAIEGLAGWYLFSDYCSGLLFAISSDASGTGLEPVAVLQTGLRVTAFGEDSTGELYLTDLEGGAIYRIVAGG